MKTVDEHLQERLERDPEFRAIWEAGRPKFEYRAALIQARVDAGLTQQELARKIGTSQSAVARIELGHVPTVDTLRRIAEALNIEFVISKGEYPVIKRRKRRRKAA